MNLFGQFFTSWKEGQQQQRLRESSSEDESNIMETQIKKSKDKATLTKKSSCVSLTPSQKEAAAFREFRNGLRDFLGGLDVFDEEDERNDAIIFSKGDDCNAFDNCYNDKYNNDYYDDYDYDDDDDEQTKFEGSDVEGRAVLVGGHDALRGRKFEVIVDHTANDNNHAALSDLEGNCDNNNDKHYRNEYEDYEFSFDPHFAASPSETYSTLSSDIRLPTLQLTTCPKLQQQKQQNQQQDNSQSSSAAAVGVLLIQTALQKYRSQLEQIKKELKRLNLFLLHECFPIIDPATDKCTAMICMNQTLQLELQYEILYQAIEQLEELLLQCMFLKPQLSSSASSLSFSSSSSTTTNVVQSFVYSSYTKSKSSFVSSGEEKQDESRSFSAEKKKKEHEEQQLQQSSQQQTSSVINQQWMSRFRKSVLSTITTHLEPLQQQNHHQQQQQSMHADEDFLFDEAVARYAAHSFLPSPPSASSTTKRGRRLWKK